MKAGLAWNILSLRISGLDSHNYGCRFLKITLNLSCWLRRRIFLHQPRHGVRHLRTNAYPMRDPLVIQMNQRRGCPGIVVADHFQVAAVARATAATWKWSATTIPGQPRRWFI